MSTPKDIIFEEQAREFLANGISKLASVVAFTLGPKGRNVGVEKGWGPPSITNDGNQIIKEIELEESRENIGVSIAKNVIQEIKDQCGDGTTTVTLLLNAFVQEGIKHISAGASPTLMKRGMEKAVEAVVAEIDHQAIEVKSKVQTKNIATVSASGNDEIGTFIAKGFERVGKGGVIVIEEAKGTETLIEEVEGMRFDRGYLSPYFCTDSEKRVAVLNAPQILIIDKKISNIHELLPALQQFATSGQELLLIAEEIDGDALSTLVINRIRGILKVTAVKAPGFGDRRRAMLEDIATLVGATVISEDKGMNLQEIDPLCFGSAERVEVAKEHTTVINGKGDKQALESRINQIDAEISKSDSSYDKEKLEERKAKLGGGVAVIRVGAATEPELKQKKQDFEDSLNATKAALEQGIVPGGGICLLNARKVIKTLSLSGDEQTGADIVYDVCETPLRQIVTNTGLEGSVVLAEIIENNSPTIGFNAKTEQTEDLIKSGVIDPAKVVKKTLLHSASAAGIVWISEALITDTKEDQD